ncbi:unnamed protein product [Ostreobium quekettii]|uniref:Helicase Helix-turn-helix domain-containing protein n=1 Tax=Ostreobium quekettii TaxID=121088 RepID=A0A8S1J2Y3_9CHLO|nr:unnamed protein product [Ostreobium quekettii]
MHFNPDHSNSVSLTGHVMEPPQRRQVRGDLTLVNVVLGCTDPAKGRTQRFKASFWGDNGEQVAAHVQAGMELAVRGRLRQYREEVTISVEEFYVVEGAYTPAPELATQEASLPSLGPNKLDCYDLYQNNRAEVVQIAQRKGIKEATVIGYVADCGAAGYPLDWSSLCRDAYLGPRECVIAVTADAIMEAAEECLSKGSETLESLQASLSKVREVLRQGPSGPMVEAQEDALLGSGFTYAQIRIVLAMMQLGISPDEWNHFIPHPQAGDQVETSVF